LFIKDKRIFEHEHPRAVLDFLGGLAVTRRRYSPAGNIRMRSQEVVERQKV
jgi:hypothetical protein